MHLPKFLILKENPIVWKKRDMYIRSVNEIKDKALPGISKPIKFYRLNCMMNLDIGSHESRKI